VIQLTLRVCVQVGGSTGQASIALAREFPQLNFIVQDRTEVASGGDAYIESLQDPRLAGRITYQAHDFFLPQHVMGADVYLLRMILHDWAFDDSIKILKNIVAAMGKSSRVLIMDTVLPDPGKALVAKERLLRVRDMAMMQTFNSQERSLDDWLAILERVDPRLDIRNIVQPHGSVMSVMEVVFEQD
jgi:6-hydroxytryprostatin B O-methyltransferase